MNLSNVVGSDPSSVLLSRAFPVNYPEFVRRPIVYAIKSPSNHVWPDGID